MLSCLFTVYVRDGGYPTLFDSTTVFVRVTDVNDNPPVFEEDRYELQVRENQPQSSIITIVAADRDVGINADIVYRISGGLSIGPDVWMCVHAYIY